MTTYATSSEQYKQYVNAKTGLVDRRIFSDPEIYLLELERIFARAWNFMAHDSMIPNPGDFFMTFIGEDRVIVVRDNDMQPQVLINSCRHRGNAVCRAEEGHATSFMCTYHGWTYDLKGALVGVPGFKEVYHEELDRENWGLIKAAQVDTYKGFIFATMDPEAPGLYEYLGSVGRMGIDLLAHRGEKAGVVGGIQKYIIPCNWKFAVDNVWDYYHTITHQSAFMARFRERVTTVEGQANARRDPSPIGAAQISVLGEYGHALGGPQYAPDRLGGQVLDSGWREDPETQRVLGPVGMKVGGHPHVFPNFWITFPGFGQVSMRMPKGPASTEIWWFTFVDTAKPEKQRAQIQSSMHTFGPAGPLEQDDGENWGQSTRGMKGTVSSRYPLHYAMNLGRGAVIEEEGPPHIESSGVTEHSQLWHYRAWSEWMTASTWSELKANHSHPTDVL